MKHGDQLQGESELTVQSPLGRIQRQKMDINVYPTEIRNPEGKCISCGDLHGNALKLLYFLIAEGVCSFKDVFHYQEIAKLYNRHSQLLEKKNYKRLISDIKEFKKLLSYVIYNTKVAKIYFIGDETADRGHNDWFTLWIFKSLAEATISFSIMLSNHGFEFLKNYLSKFVNVKTFITSETCVRSLFNLEKLINLSATVRQNEVSREQVCELAKNYYIPNLKLLCYSPAPSVETDLAVYHHAPVAMEVITGIAEKLKIRFTIIIIKDLCVLIDKINQFFSEKRDVVINHIMDEYKFFEQVGHTTIPADYPFLRLIWNRTNTHDAFLKAHPQLTFVHGHDGYEDHPEYKNLINLDSLFGRECSKRCLEKESYVYRSCRVVFNLSLIQYFKGFGIVNNTIPKIDPGNTVISFDTVATENKTISHPAKSINFFPAYNKMVYMLTPGTKKSIRRIRGVFGIVVGFAVYLAINIGQQNEDNYLLASIYMFLCGMIGLTSAVKDNQSQKKINGLPLSCDKIITHTKGEVVYEKCSHPRPC